MCIESSGGADLLISSRTAARTLQQQVVFPTHLCGVLVFCSVSRSLFVSRPLLVLLSHTHSIVTHTHTTSHNIVAHNSFTQTTLSHTQPFHMQLCHAQLFRDLHRHNSLTQVVTATLLLRGTRGAGVAFGDMDAHFVWQAWHLVTLMLAWCGRYGTWRRDADDSFLWQEAWHSRHWAGSGGATKLSHTTLSHALLRAHTHTTLSTLLLHTQHCDTQHNSFTHNSLTQNSFAHISFTQTETRELEHTALSHTHNIVTHHSFTHSHSHRTPSHTIYCHTQHFHTKLFCPHPFSHTTLSQTALSHTTLSRNSVTHAQLCHTLLFHTICNPTISFLFHAFPIPFSHMLCVFEEVDMWGCPVL